MNDDVIRNSVYTIIWSIVLFSIYIISSFEFAVISGIVMIIVSIQSLESGLKKR